VGRPGKALRHHCSPQYSIFTDMLQLLGCPQVDFLHPVTFYASVASNNRRTVH